MDDAAFRVHSAERGYTVTAIETLAQFAVAARPDPSVQAQIAPAVVDCFGCILAGANSAVARQTRAALALVAPGPVRVYGADQTLSAPVAVLVNGVAGHAWDLDDWEEPGNTHPTVVLLPALLASAHLTPVSGKDLMTAYAVGAEIIMQLGKAVSLAHYARGFHSTATLGVIGVAGAVSRLLGLSADQTVHALSFAVSQAAGYTRQFGSNAKPLQAGWAARNGVEAALLAAQGLTGQPHVMDHERGFAGLLSDYDAKRFSGVMSRLGRDWALSDYGLILKPWPSCGYTHRLMTAAVEIRSRLAGGVHGITAIEAFMPDFHYEILPFDRPASRTEALFSAPACVAQVLAKGQLSLRDSADAFWADPEVARLIDLTTVKAEQSKNPALNYDPDQPDRLRVELTSGEIVQATCAAPLGHPSNPMTPDQLADKFSGLTGLPEDSYKTALNWPQADNVASFFDRIDQ